MMSDKIFTQGLLAGFLTVGILFAVVDVLLMRVGELNLDAVIDRQLNGENILFSSGINQDVYEYKFNLMEELKPEVVVIGSSRAMQVRKEFFTKSFINLGGTISNVSDLEHTVKKLSASNPKPKLLLLYMDPWWFNSRFPGASQSHIDVEFPHVINLDIARNAISTLHRGNWLARFRASRNLGIHAILTDEGFANDGSYHYTSTISGKRNSSDAGFSSTLQRIAHDKQRFERNDHADSRLINRACDAIKQLGKSADHVVILAPPFANVVWNKMMLGGYEYINDAHLQLQRCATESTFIDFANPNYLPESTDCEFIDGFHGGDTTAARMLVSISSKDIVARQYIDSGYIAGFLQKYKGHAAGITAEKISTAKEVDFLKIGCQK